MSKRYAKIVCTIGPAVDSPEGIRELVEADGVLSVSIRVETVC
jgi:pyruvate kinase